MNKVKWTVLSTSITIIFSGCASMNNMSKGVAIGGGSGAALGAILGGAIGKSRGVAIDAAIGTVIDAGTGASIGKKTGKVAAEAKQIEGAQAEQTTDNDGLQVVKVTLDSGILFTTGNVALSAVARSASSKFVNNALNQSKDMDVSIYGYTNSQGWRNSTTGRSRQRDPDLSQERARSIVSYLLNCDVFSNQIKDVQGTGENNPVASNDMAVGGEQNRRVEVYMYISEQMIKDAQVASD